MKLREREKVFFCSLFLFFCYTSFFFVCFRFCPSTLFFFFFLPSLSFTSYYYRTYLSRPWYAVTSLSNASLAPSAGHLSGCRATAIAR